MKFQNVNKDFLKIFYFFLFSTGFYKKEISKFYYDIITNVRVLCFQFLVLKLWQHLF